MPGLCLGDAVSSIILPSLSQIPLSISSDLGGETNFGIVLASELLLPWLGPFLVTGKQQIEKGGKISSANMQWEQILCSFCATCLSRPAHQHSTLLPLKVTEEA